MQPEEIFDVQLEQKREIDGTPRYAQYETEAIVE